MARETLAKQFLDNDDNPEKYLVFIDSDMVFEPGDVEKLLWDMEQDKKIGAISAMCVFRDGSYRPVAKWIEDDAYVDGKEIHRRVAKYMEYKEVRGVDFQGTGFMVVRREALASMDRPWFPSGYDSDCNYKGEDVNFIWAMKKKGWKTCIDFGVQVGHIGKQIYTPDVLLENHPEFEREKVECLNS